MPVFVTPQLCQLVKHAPAGDAWAHEIKLDGYRVAARLLRQVVYEGIREDKSSREVIRCTPL
jgi:ATP-dependent DNA ligase